MRVNGKPWRSLIIPCCLLSISLVAPAEGGVKVPVPEADKAATINLSPRPPAAPVRNAAPTPYDKIFEYDVGTATGDNQCLGVEFDGVYYWITGANSGSDPNKLYKLNSAGGLLAVYDQPAHSTDWGWRDLAYDGTYLYASVNGNVDQIDPATGQWTQLSIPGPEFPNRGLAYDPATDHFWTANFAGNIYEFDRGGNVINNYPNSEPIYGLAWDDVSLDGSWLWTYSQYGPPNVLISQFDPSQGDYTGVTYLGAYHDYTNCGAGGAAFARMGEKAVFIGLTQDVPEDIIFGLSVGLAVTPSPTPVGYRTPSPTPTVSPTPEGYRSPTPPGAIPFAEGFEGVWSGGAPELWSMEHISGSTNWEQTAGGYNGHPPRPYSGAYNARFFYYGYGRVTRLITPRLYFGSQTDNPRLTFQLAMEQWEGDQDELAIYYKNSEGSPWTLLAYYDVCYCYWREQTVELPDPSDDYYLCFSGIGKWGCGVCIDDVLITGELAPSSPTPSPGSTLPPPSCTPTPTCGPVVPLPEFILESGDYDGDGTSDIALFRPASGMWAVRDVTRVYFGGAGDRTVSGDYDGDGTTDLAIFRGASGMWAVRGLSRIYYGGAGDFPSPGDYDGDGTADVAIFRSGSGMWAARGLPRIYFGAAGDRPVPADYDGDGWSDLAVFRPGTGLWAIRLVSRIYYGGAGDWTLPADYDGDGSASAAIFRPSSGMWAVRDLTRVYYGCCTDWPVEADFDGDGTADIGIFRRASGLWGIRGVTRAYFGGSGDIPVTR